MASESILNNLTKMGTSEHVTMTEVQSGDRLDEEGRKGRNQ